MSHFEDFDKASLEVKRVAHCANVAVRNAMDKLLADFPFPLGDLACVMYPDLLAEANARNESVRLDLDKIDEQLEIATNTCQAVVRELSKIIARLPAVPDEDASGNPSPKRRRGGRSQARGSGSGDARAAGACV